MIHIKIEGHSFKYEIENIIKLFYDKDEIVFDTESPAGTTGVFLFNGIMHEDGREVIKSYIKVNENTQYVTTYIYELIRKNPGMAGSKAIKKELQRQAYILLEKHTGIKQPWGILTGIRPAKIVHEMMQEGHTKQEITDHLYNYYIVSREKAELLYNVAEAEKVIIEGTSAEAIGIYIGMPFCPTRCLYCSFTSNPIGKYKDTVEKYLDALKYEIAGTASIIKEKGYKIQSIYFGGGTPTSIDSHLLDDLLGYIETELDMSTVKEYTLEAGRPDSVDYEKLSVIKNSKVDRISINPQTMNDETLKLIGRNHSAEEIVKAYSMAREIGFDNINMDVIVGLPGENTRMFENTLEEISKLGPESLTVHTMTIKRASRLNENKENYNLVSSTEASKMLELAHKYSISMGMHPYYLYRQKNMLGNLENIGYSRPGYESIYNVQIMEEKQTIIALGAGAITKVVYNEENRIERAFNVKSVEEYIARTDEMLKRKRALMCANKT